MTDSKRNHVAEYRKGAFVISTDRKRLDLKFIHGFLTKCYWAKGISRKVVAESIRNSLCFGVYPAKRQIGFGRVISDLSTYGYVGDVFIAAPYRGRGLGKWLMECIMRHSRLQGLRRWSLVTRDAHGLYGQVGFTPLKFPKNHMEIHRPDLYA
jgi:GNAT superfamily N-acetyltransferase